jgi:hypothetical protein
MMFEQVLPRRLARWVSAEPDWDQVYAEQLPRVLNFFRYRRGDTADVEDLPPAPSTRPGAAATAIGETPPGSPRGC